MNSTRVISWFRFRLVAVLAAASLAVAACASDGAETSSGFLDGADQRSGDESADGPTRPSAPEPVDQAAEAPAEEPADQSSEEWAQEPAQEPADAPAGGADDRGALDADDAMGDDAEGLFAPGDDGDAEARFDDNTFVDHGRRVFVEAAHDRLSTFALDVDTGSFTVARRWVQEGALPPVESVRPEEFVNAYRYDYRSPRRGLDVEIEGAPSPYDGDNVLVRIGVSSHTVEADDRPPAALTFVVDTSGSMDRDDRLGLVKEALEVLVDELDDDDTVAIVTYESSAGIVLEPTPVSQRRTILRAIDDLTPGGSTNLEAGLVTGYDLARDAFRDGGVNRVVLASDGVANVGLTDPDGLASMIRHDADAGIHLVTVGFGMGNFNDHVMEQLADQGDGFYAYVDDDDEAERLFSDELTATLVTVAVDAKIQVDFDPEVVDEYRLIGFENRGVLDRDFRNDDVDAGEVGAGHQVTAIYEVKLHPGFEPGDPGELGEVFLRWEDPDDGEVIEIDEDIDLRDVAESWADTSASLRAATVLASFAEVLRGSTFTTDLDLGVIADSAVVLGDELDDRAWDEVTDVIVDAARLG